MINSQSVRQAFIDFFKDKAHSYVPSSPVVPQNDPTILFTNAGMNQFKDVFLGTGTRPYSRAVNSQVCIRVSGKHNDLEDVGLDTTHLTSFEMLGNWSFGDYYKKEAIMWAWEFLVDRMKLPADKLYATVFQDDHESADLWKAHTPIQPENVLFFGHKENFWEMGEVGPCGPCSELHLDRGPSACDKPHETHICAVNGVCARYIELWNLVFIQYNREVGGQLNELPNKHVDTGAGLERLVAYIQGTQSNYNTDLFAPIIKKIEEITGIPYQEGPDGMAHRVLADHTRTLTFAISDNVLPSNEGRGYVLRRLLRRALRYAAKLGINRPIIHELVPVVISILGSHFDGLPKRETFIRTVVESEEIQFLKTLHSGIRLFDEIAGDTESKGHSTISGEASFKLYDTFGFPIDLTTVMAKERHLTVDLPEFERQLEIQRNRSRTASKQSKESQGKLGTDTSGDVDLKTQELNSKLRAINPPKTVAMGGEARIVTHPADRVGMAKHHSVTHLLQAVLREQLGDHVFQAGSLVDVDHLRFDFSHFKGIGPDGLAVIEAKVNQLIAMAIPVDTFETGLDEAKALGAMALFGEKYEEIVRVVKMGDVSMELCVGTHVPNTGDIEAFKIIHEGAIAAGTRRIEAIAGTLTIANYEQSQKDNMRQKIEAKQAQLSQYPAVKIPLVTDEHTLSDLQQIDATLTTLIKQAEKNATQSLEQDAADIAKKFSETTQLSAQHNYKFCIIKIDYLNPKIARLIAECVLQAQPIGTIAIVAVTSSSDTALAIKCTNDITTCHANELIGIATAIAGGSGGGKSHFAQAGGLASQHLELALDAIRRAIS